jgi:hypothetical protein
VRERFDEIAAGRAFRLAQRAVACGTGQQERSVSPVTGAGAMQHHKGGNE